MRFGMIYVGVRRARQNYSLERRHPDYPWNFFRVSSAKQSLRAIRKSSETSDLMTERGKHPATANTERSRCFFNGIQARVLINIYIFTPTNA